MKFDQITFEIFKKAIEIYLKIAYPNGVKEKSFCYQNILNFNNSKNISELFSIFEKETISYEGTRKKIKYSARLGSEKYPYLKLVLQEGGQKNDFGFLVDRHTEYLALIQTSISYQQENEIKSYTRNLKYQIEEEFERNGIPTFREIIRNETKQLMDIYESKNITSNNIKVLLVDDDNDLLELIRLNLEILGYKVKTATNGEEAVEKVFHDINDIMVLDLMMSGMSGFDVVKFVGKKIPVIVLTALSDEITKENCIRDGAIEVLTKPIEISVLDKLIKNIVKR